MMPRWLLPCLCGALGCASTPTAPASPPQAASSAPAATAAGAGWTAVDPRAVRCGVDDGPRNIIGARPAPGADQGALPGVDEGAGALLAAPMPTARRRTRFVDMPAPEFEPEPPLYIERLPAKVLSGPAPAGLAEAFASINPQFEVCHPLVTAPAPNGESAFDLELASTGAPLRVEPTAEGPISPHTRCLMERVCQYRPGVAPGQPTRVRVALRLSPEPPRPPSLPVPPGPEVRVDALSEGTSAGGDELRLQLRAAATEAARRCGAVEGRARVRFSVDLQVTTSAPSRRRRVAVPSTVATVVQIRTQNLEGRAPPGVVACVVGDLQGRAFAPGNGPRLRTEATILTWNP